MSEQEAIEALEHLGLSNYEARVFVALQQLGSGTALEVHRVSDVPRSQVYGTAEQLQNRGFIEIQESSPKRYQPVSLGAARAQLVGQLEREEARAFQALEGLKREQPIESRHEAVSTLRGREPIHERVESLLDRAEERIVFGAAGPGLVSSAILDRLHERAGDGVEVTVVSENEAVRDLFDTAIIAVHAPPAVPPDGFSGRVVLADGDLVLLSVESAAGGSSRASEIALWSAHTAIARILVQFLWSGIQAFLGRDDPSPR